MTWPLTTRHTGAGIMAAAEYPADFPLVESSDITSWNQWPDDVVDQIYRLNTRGRGPWRLSFYGAPRVFKCSGCHRFCKRQRGGTAHVYRKHWPRGEAALFCDECMIRAARGSA